MDGSLGWAHAKVQYIDDDKKNEVSVDSCPSPVNCFYWIDTEELAVIQHLTQPQQKGGHGIYGQGWERPANVFMAAKSLNKQLKQQREEMKRVPPADVEETPSQAQTRANASIKLKTASFSTIWSSLKEMVHK